MRRDNKGGRGRLEEGEAVWGPLYVIPVLAVLLMDFRNSKMSELNIFPSEFFSCAKHFCSL